MVIESIDFDNKSITRHLYEISSGTSKISPTIDLKISNQSFIISILGVSGPTKWLAIRNAIQKSNLKCEIIELNAVYYNDDVKLLKQFLIEIEKICGCIPTTNLNLLSYKQRLVACLDILQKINKFIVLIVLNSDKTVKTYKRGKVSKQVFLYTLVDSIVVDSPIGIIFDTSDLLFTDKLEKRVKSRFISNHEFVEPISKARILKMSSLSKIDIEKLNRYYDLMTLHGYDGITVMKQIFYSKLLDNELSMPFSQKDYILNILPSLGIYEHLVLICLVLFHVEMKSPKTLFMIYDEAKRLYTLDNEPLPSLQTITRVFIGLIQQTIIEWSLSESKTLVSISNTPCRFPMYKIYKDMAINGNLKIPTEMLKWMN